MSFADRLAEVQASIEAACRTCGRRPEDVALLPISKRQPESAIAAAHGAGLARFGENRVQELAIKAGALAKLGIAWHLVGSLQTNKVERLLAVPGLAMVQSLDRPRLADALQAALAGKGRELEVLVQVNATGEAAKHGVAPKALDGLVDHLLGACPALRLTGLMAMGPLHGDPASTFATVAVCREALRRRTGLALPVLSMGMSGDLPAAIRAGSTMVRVGTALFGAGARGT